MGGSDSDPYLTLLNYRMTSVEYGLSSADILFNRKLKTGLSGLLEADVRVSEYYAEQQIRQNKNTQYNLRSQKLQLLHENEAVHICDGKSWLQTAQVSKQATLYNSVCVSHHSGVYCGELDDSLPIPAGRRYRVMNWCHRGKKPPRDCSEQAVGQNRTRTIEINREKKESCWSLSSGGQCSPSLKGVTVQSCVYTPLETAACHAKRAMPSSHQVHPASAIRNYPVITG